MDELLYIPPFTFVTVEHIQNLYDRNREWALEKLREIRRENNLKPRQEVTVYHVQQHCTLPMEVMIYKMTHPEVPAA